MHAGSPTGALLATAKASAVADKTEPMWLRFTFSTAVSVSPGQTYVFVARSHVQGVAGSPLWYKCSAGYAAGTAYTSAHGVYTDTQTDLAFRTVSAPATPSISIGDASILEGDVGTRTLLFPVTLSEPAASPVTVSYSIAGITATGGSAPAPGIDFDDQGGATGAVTFAMAGTKTERLAYVSVPVFADTTSEPDETISVTLSSPGSGYQLGRVEATGTILNDDGVTAGTTIGVGDAMVVRGRVGSEQLRFSVTLSQAVPGGIALNYLVTPGTATWSKSASGGGAFGGPLSGPIKFSSSATSKTIKVSVWPDTNPGDLAQTFSVTLGGVNGPSTSGLHATATGTIVPVPTGPNLSRRPSGVTVGVGVSCTAIDPLNGPVPGSELVVSWSAPNGGEPPTGYEVGAVATSPSVTQAITVPASQTSATQCLPVGARVASSVASVNDAGSTPPVGQPGGVTDVPPSDLSWTSPPSISTGVPATFASATPCPANTTGRDADLAERPCRAGDGLHIGRQSDCDRIGGSRRVVDDADVRHHGSGRVCHSRRRLRRHHLAAGRHRAIHDELDFREPGTAIPGHAAPSGRTPASFVECNTEAGK